MLRFFSKAKNSSLQKTDKVKDDNTFADPASLFKFLMSSDDFTEQTFEDFTLYYFESLIDKALLQNKLDHAFVTILKDTETIKDTTKLNKKLLEGYCAVLIKNTNQIKLIDVGDMPSRSISPPEAEATIIGPQVSFNEDVSQSINLIRNTLRTNDLVIRQFSIGEVAPKKVSLIFLKSQAKPEQVKKIEKKLNSLKIKYLSDTLSFDELIPEHPLSLFPQFLQTERLDRTCANLIEGKIALLAEGSPVASLLPHHFGESLQSPEDYYTNWISGSFIRLLRFTAFFIALLLTAVYVAVMSYHYLIIPPDLIIIIAESRAQVPFSPLVEALLMEFAVEFLREAGSRLPTRIGQTVGIVGGIIIGQAAVMAGITSNILIIVVSISMLSTLVIPSYQLSNAVRILRFILILTAGFMGGLGVAAGMFIILVYMSRLESLGEPYFTSVSPINIEEFRDSLVRLPLLIQKTNKSK
jgi:hypothetical protein